MSLETTYVDVIPFLFCLLPSLCYIDVRSIESNAMWRDHLGGLLSFPLLITTLYPYNILYI